MADNLTHSSFFGCPCYRKIEEVPFKNEGARVVKKKSHCKSMQIFYDARGQLNQQSEVAST